jgi:hypothetical protein
MQWKEEGGKDFTPAPVGNHLGRCIKLIDLGTQFGEYQGQPTSSRKVAISFELPNELMAEGEFAGKPFIVTKIYTASLSEKANLRKDLVNWRGREFTPEELSGFESKNILGKPCMVNVTHTDKGKAKVSGVSALPRGFECPPQVNRSVYFSLESKEFDGQVLETLSKFYREMIIQSPEYKRLFSVDPVKSHAVEVDEDIPF